MRFCYADPPYIGLAHRYPEKEEVDHAALIERLCSQYPDGWALSCHTPSLRILLPLCPPDVRILAWVKPFCSFKPGVGLAYAWEPVLLRGGRKRSRKQQTTRDWCAANSTLQKGLVGAKPERFCLWLFATLGMEAEDTLEDLYPGTGVVGRTWDLYRQHLRWQRGEHLQLISQAPPTMVDTEPQPPPADTAPDAAAA